jgi:hypothetical protein
VAFRGHSPPWHGRVVQGDWVDGRREGFGIFRSRDGKEYIGEASVTGQWPFSVLLSVLDCYWPAHQERAGAG